MYKIKSYIILLLIYIILNIYIYLNYSIWSDNWYWYDVLLQIKRNNIEYIYTNMIPIITPYFNITFELITWINIYKYSNVLFLFILLLILIKKSNNNLFNKVSLFILFIFWTTLSNQLLFSSWYYTFILFWFISFYYWIDYIKSWKRSYLILSWFFFTVNIYSFTIWILFSILFLSYFIFNSNKGNFLKFIKLWITLLLFALPWLYWHIDVWWLWKFYYSPYNWWILDVLPYINSNFWQYENSTFLLIMKSHIVVFISQFSILFIFVIFFVKIKSCKYHFLLSLLLLVLINIILNISPFDRYYLLPVFIILIFSIDFINIKTKKVVYFIFIFFIFITSNIFSNFSKWYIYNNNINSRFEQLDKCLEKKWNILARTLSYNELINDKMVFSAYHFSKEEFILLLSGKYKTKDNILNEKNIAYIITKKPHEVWLLDYYYWVEELYGKNNNFLDYIVSNYDLVCEISRYNIYYKK